MRPVLGLKAHFPHHGRKIQLFTDEHFVYFRPKGAEPDWLGALHEWHLASLAKGGEAYRFPLLINRSRRAIEQGHFFRAFILPDPRPKETRLWRVHWRPDVGYAFPVDLSYDYDESEGGFTGAFFHPRQTIGKKFNNLFKAPQEALQNHFLAEWHDETSDVRQALPWCDWRTTNREWRAVEWFSGSREQLEQLIRFACYSASRLWAGSSEIEFSSMQTQSALFVFVTYYQEGNEKGFSPRLKQLFKTICAHNEAAFHPEQSRIRWRLDWLEYEGFTALHTALFMNMLLAPPTQREAANAREFMRGWMGENAPDLLPEWED